MCLFMITTIVSQLPCSSSYLVQDEIRKQAVSEALWFSYFSTLSWFQLGMNYSVNQKYLNKLSRKIHYLYLQKRLVLSESVLALLILGV